MAKKTSGGAKKEASKESKVSVLESAMAVKMEPVPIEGAQAKPVTAGQLAKCLRELLAFSEKPSTFRRGMKGQHVRIQAEALLKRFDG